MPEPGGQVRGPQFTSSRAPIPIRWTTSTSVLEPCNYIMRVMENVQVYAAKMNGGSAPITLTADLKRGGYSYGGPAQPLPTIASAVTPSGDEAAPALEQGAGGLEASGTRRSPKSTAQTRSRPAEGDDGRLRSLHPERRHDETERQLLDQGGDEHRRAQADRLAGDQQEQQLPGDGDQQEAVEIFRMNEFRRRRGDLALQEQERDQDGQAIDPGRGEHPSGEAHGLVGHQAVQQAFQGDGDQFVAVGQPGSGRDTPSAPRRRGRTSTAPGRRCRQFRRAGVAAPISRTCKLSFFSGGKVAGLLRPGPGRSHDRAAGID